ncbi:MAG: hypothetical protein AAF530_20000 [Pseudomonadota bacterium]
MSTHFKNFVVEQSSNELLNAEGDELFSKQGYLINGAANFFVFAGRALIEDGLDKKTIARMMVEAAHQTLADIRDPYCPEEQARAARLIIDMGLDFMPEDDPNKAKN